MQVHLKNAETARFNRGMTFKRPFNSLGIDLKAGTHRTREHFILTLTEADVEALWRTGYNAVVTIHARANMPRTIVVVD